MAFVKVGAAVSSALLPTKKDGSAPGLKHKMITKVYDDQLKKNEPIDVSSSSQFKDMLENTPKGVDNLDKNTQDITADYLTKLVGEKAKISSFDFKDAKFSCDKCKHF